MNRFSIKDIENLTGIKAHTIRIWEQRYGILQPKRTATNIRFYDGEALKTALRVSMLNNAGYKISRIGQMTETDMETLIGKIGDADFQTNVQVNKLLEHALAIQPFAFERVLIAHIRRYGLQNAIETIVFGFLEKIGLMWMMDKLTPAQEHIASAVISRKIQAAIDAMPIGDENLQDAILLFLPEGEIHEIALLYVYYLMRRRNIACIYLGANVPVSEAAIAARATGATRVYVHITSVVLPGEPARYIRALAKAMPAVTIYISGNMLRDKKIPQAQNIHYVGSLEQAKTVIAGL